MLIALNEVISQPGIDPERRLRWIADIGAKIGMTHAKALVQQKLDEVSVRVLGPAGLHANEMESTAGVVWPATSRFAASNTVQLTAGELGDDPETEEDP
jgi:hypothetical protein